MAIYRAVKAINRQVALFVQSGGLTIVHPEPCVCRLRQLLYRFLISVYVLAYSLQICRGNRLAKVSEAWLRFVLYNLVHVIHNKSMHEVPLQ